MARHSQANALCVEEALGAQIEYVAARDIIVFGAWNYLCCNCLRLNIDFDFKYRVLSLSQVLMTLDFEAGVCPDQAGCTLIHLRAYSSS